MRMGLCLALLVCTVLVIESDAMWWRKRSTGAVDKAPQSEQDEVRCADMVNLDDVTNVGMPIDRVKVVLKMLDSDDGDDVLDEKEYLLFMEAMGGLKHCFSNETSSEQNWGSQVG